MPVKTSLANLVLAAAAALGALPATAREGEPLTWFDADAERPLDHTVLVRGPLAAVHDKVTVRGPVALVAADPAGDAGPCFTVYRIAAPADGPPGRIVLDAETPVRLGPAEFLLVPATRLTDGPAAAGGVAGVYEARPILEPSGPTPAADRPTHVCLPVDYRHHFERVEVTDARRGMVIFAAREADAAPAPVAVVDDFGTNRLTPGRMSRPGSWSAVRADGAP